MSSEGVPRQAEREAAWEKWRTSARSIEGDDGPRCFDAGWEARDPEVRALTEALGEATHRMAAVAGRLRLRERDASVPSVASDGDYLAEKLPEFRTLARRPVPVEGEADR